MIKDIAFYRLGTICKGKENKILFFFLILTKKKKGSLLVFMFDWIRTPLESLDVLLFFY